MFVFFFKQKTAYEMRISDWSSDVCSSDLGVGVGLISGGRPVQGAAHGEAGHMRVRRARGDDFAGACPFHGDYIEGLIAGSALAKRFGRPGRELADGGPEWDLFVHDLTGLLHNMVVTAAPARIAIAGGVMTAPEHPPGTASRR